jgi:geranylgeranyl diphosphate synthase, type I
MTTTNFSPANFSSAKAVPAEAEPAEAVPAQTRDGARFTGVRAEDDAARPAATERSASAILDETRQLVEGAHRAAVAALPPSIRHMAGYHIGWWDADGTQSVKAGKAIRPAFTLACARAAAGCCTSPRHGKHADPKLAHTGRAVDAAVAVELVHDFSLLHDDVMDGDVTRRHRPTTWMVFGVGQAILVGDALLAVAIRQLADAEAVAVLADAVQELCIGQSADLAFEQRAEVAVAECQAVAEGKTGALLGAACQLGAMAAGADAATAEHYRTFGRELGLAFQLVDDLLGIWGDPAVTGKPAGSDLASRKKSLPVVAALSSGTRAGANLARLYGREGDLDRETIAHAADLVEAAGGRAWASAEAGRRIDSAMDALAGARPGPAGASDLRTLSALIIGRNH